MRASTINNLQLQTARLISATVITLLFILKFYLNTLATSDYKNKNSENISSYVYNLDVM